MHHSVPDETALVVAFQTRQPGALETVYDKYAAALYGIIHKIVRDDAIAEDLLQDVFVRIWRNAESYSSEKGRFFTWMLNISRNAAIDHLRSSAHKSRANIQNIEDSVGIIERSNPSRMDVDHIGLRELLDKLEPDQRVLIEMAYFQGFSQAELAEELNIPLGTIKSRMRIALRNLRNWMT
jgi:RNA polymerase sigma-70 factor (ECF subfamily)